jgi:uncharacterized membrane protein (UPF0127 family)
MRKYMLVFIFCPLFLSSVVHAAGITKACCRGICVQAQIAASEEERAQGLMFRKTLEPEEGMLFVFDQQLRYSFWMKNMNFPLDLIWINQDKVVVDITRNAQPCVEACESLVPAEAAKYVLEVNAGFALKHHIQTGDRMDF